MELLNKELKGRVNITRPCTEGVNVNRNGVVPMNRDVIMAKLRFATPILEGVAER